MTIIRYTVALFLVLACTACGMGQDPMASPSVGSAPSVASPAPTRARTPAAKPPDQPAPAMLPRGGREIFPRYRLVGYAGVTGASTLGRLGTGPLNQRVAEIESRAKPYAAGREILPVVEVIATVVQGSPGRDGKYRVRLTDAQIAKYHKAARKHRAVLLLNLQPGRSEFIAEAKAFRKWLKEPDVGVALDLNGRWIEVNDQAGCTGIPLGPSWMGFLVICPAWSSSTTFRRR